MTALLKSPLYAQQYYPVTVVGIVREFHTTRRPILPPRLFKTRTTLILLLSVFIHAFTFYAVPFCELNPLLDMVGCYADLWELCRSSLIFSKPW